MDSSAETCSTCAKDCLEVDDQWRQRLKRVHFASFLCVIPGSVIILLERCGYMVF